MRIEILPAMNGTQYYFRIVASNNQVLATSETYRQKASAVSSARAVQSGAGGARLIDHT